MTIRKIKLYESTDILDIIQNMNYMDKIIPGDCLEILKELPEQSVNLIFTSPPYADQRSSTYGGIKPDHYVEWFLPKTV